MKRLRRLPCRSSIPLLASCWGSWTTAGEAVSGYLGSPLLKVGGAEFERAVDRKASVAEIFGDAQFFSASSATVAVDQAPLTARLCAGIEHLALSIAYWTRLFDASCPLFVHQQCLFLRALAAHFCMKMPGGQAALFWTSFTE
jgi:hypothetical protein